MLTLNQIISWLRTIQEGHDQLNSFNFGDPFEFGASDQIRYPALLCGLEDSSLSNKILTTKIYIIVCDRVNKDESNENEVLSDTRSILLDVYAQFWAYLEDNNIVLSRETNLTSFTEEFDDEVSGWKIEVNVNQFYSKDTCQIPGTFPDPPLPDDDNFVTIIDQDDNVLATPSPPDFYRVTVLDGIQDTITANEVTILDNIL